MKSEPRSVMEMAELLKSLGFSGCPHRRKFFRPRQWIKSLTAHRAMYCPVCRTKMGARAYYDVRDILLRILPEDDKKNVNNYTHDIMNAVFDQLLRELGEVVSK